MKMKTTLFSVFTLFAAVAMLTSCVSKKKYDEAVARHAAEKSALESQLASSQEQNEQMQAQSDTLQQNLNMSQEEIAALSEQVKQGNEQVAALQEAIAEAFETYNPEDVRVEERSGKLYIIMNNGILFNAGRASVTKDSRAVIDTLAKVFNENPDLAILVEGHTDNDPVVINKGRYRDNWSLSTARSLEVVRMLEKAGVDGSRMTASGKGETQPIADNSTKEGKMQNRRTEFVVVPKTDGLYRMYKSGFEGGSTK